jgi:hypothetical protein
MSRSILLAKDYRGEAAGWIKVGEALPKEGDLVGITHEQGYRIAYFGWRHVTPWPYSAGDEQAWASLPDPQAEFLTNFKVATLGQDYFVVTMQSDFDSQTMLKTYLYDHYPVYSEGEGYLIFDLTQARSAGS